MKLFISHIHEEAKLALVLKDWIESTFAGQCEVFVSSDGEDIPAGAKWLEKINDALDSSKLLITLCSLQSIIRPWINFETGCAWIKGIPVIPICHSGFTKSNLPQPLSMFQGLNLQDQKFPKTLFESIARYFRISKMPRIAFSEMVQELEEARSGIKSSKKAVINAIEQTHKSAGGLEKIEAEILVFFSKVGQRQIQVDHLSGNFQMQPQKMQYYLDRLKDGEFISASYSMMSPTAYSLSKKGRAYLVEKDLM